MFRPNYLTKIISILKVIIRKTGKEREREIPCLKVMRDKLYF